MHSKAVCVKTAWKCDAGWRWAGSVLEKLVLRFLDKVELRYYQNQRQVPVQVFLSVRNDWFLRKLKSFWPLFTSVFSNIRTFPALVRVYRTSMSILSFSVPSAGDGLLYCVPSYQQLSAIRYRRSAFLFLFSFFDHLHCVTGPRRRLHHLPGIIELFLPACLLDL